MGKRLDRLGPCPSLLMRLDGATPRPIPMPRRNATTQTHMTNSNKDHPTKNSRIML